MSAVPPGSIVINIIYVILTFVGTIIATVFLTFFIQAFFKGNPMNRMDFVVRKYFLSKKLEGKNLSFSNRYSSDGDLEYDEIVNQLGLDQSTGTDQLNIKLQERCKVKIDAFTQRGKWLYEFKFKNESVNGELELSFLNNQRFDSDSKVNEFSTDMKITNWKYKDLPYILLDLISIQGALDAILSEIFPAVYQRGAATLNIETDRPTPAMQYFSKLKTNLIIGSADNLKISLGLNNVSMTGTINGDMAKKISDIVIWYV